MTAMQIVAGVESMRDVDWQHLDSQDTLKYEFMIALIIIMATVNGF